MTQNCKKCGKLKKYFAKGLCRSCYSKKWYAENQEYAKKYYKKHKEEKKEYSRKAYIRNLESIRERDKKWQDLQSRQPAQGVNEPDEELVEQIIRIATSDLEYYERRVRIRKLLQSRQPVVK